MENKKEIIYEEAEMFLHCKECLDEFMKSKDYIDGKVSPQEAMAAEGASMPYMYTDKTIENIFVLFCKKCQRVIWDSRNLTPRV